MEDQKIPTLVKAKATGHIYQFHGDNKFENLTTGKVGLIKEEDAKKFFVIPLTLNKFAMENEHLVSLIKGLNLQIDNQ